MVHVGSLKVLSCSYILKKRVATEMIELCRNKHFTINMHAANLSHIHLYILPCTGYYYHGRCILQAQSHPEVQHLLQTTAAQFTA